MWKALFATQSSAALLLLRLPLGVDMVVHGWAKITNISGAMLYFDGLNVPHFLGWLAIFAEFFGGIGLLLGCLTRVAAFGVGVTMAVAIYLRHWDYGYLMNWHGALPFGTEGWEYHTLAIGMALALMIEGAGKLSADRWLTTRLAHSHMGDFVSPELLEQSAEHLHASSGSHK